MINIFSLSFCVNMSRAQSKANKLAVLKIIKKKKKYLFGSLQNNSITKTQKQHAWAEVLKTAHSLGLATANREWTYARDHLFGLWKSRTLAKRDNAKRTGTVTGKNAVLNEVDNCILDILGNESTVSQGLGQAESDVVSSNSESAHTRRAISDNKSNPSKRKLNSSDKHEKLMVQLLESELYKNKLKILLLEKQLGMKRSKFTTDLKEESNDENGSSS